jgi:hypothetical protein
MPDWDDVVGSNTDAELPPGVDAMLMRMPEGPAVMYAMGKNPSLLTQLQGQPPFMQAVMLGQVAASLKSATPQVSNAPKPGTPVGSKPGSTSEPPTDPDAYMAWASKHLK